jgi:hypothetical protein
VKQTIASLLIASALASARCSNSADDASSTLYDVGNEVGRVTYTAVVLHY